MDNTTDNFDPTRFKPMTEGLGLNHFADGLPYTPTGSRRKPMVQFNFPPPRSPRASEEPQAVEAPVAAVAPETTFESEESAGFVRRILAFAIDVVISTSMFAAIVWASFSLNGFDISQLLSERRGVQMFWPLTLLYLVVHMGYFLIQETTWRRTIGKSLLGIRIRSTSGFATLGRAVCFFVAAIPFGVGLLWYFFDSRRRCWHDVITDSDVVSASARN
jgi:uncharacterized RDD family membrane protein YckC